VPAPPVETAVGKIPMELYHLFIGQPQCVLLDDVYVSDRHLHKETEMAYVLSGEVEIIAEDRLFRMTAGELFCIPGNVLHQYLGKRQPGDIIKIKFIKEWLIPPFFRATEKEAYHKLFSQVFRTRPDPVIAEIVRGMLDNAFASYREFFLLGRLTELTAYLLQNTGAIAESKPVAYENFRYLESALNYMQENCFSQLTLKMLADHLGLTESYCSRYIARNTGITFVECLNAMRVNNAQRLLIYTDYNMTEIMEQTGFSSIQSFNRVFKAQMGQSPGDYRKQKKKYANAGI